MTRFEEIEKRMKEIGDEMDQPGADLDKLLKEARALKAEKESAEKRRQIREAVERGDGVKTPEQPDMEARGKGGEVFDDTSPEYRTAWLKTIAVDKEGRKLFGELSEKEQRAFTFVTTNTAQVVPKDIANRIVELVRSQSPILDDATFTYFTRGFGVPRLKAITAGDAKVVTEGQANDDEQDTFDLLNLVGVEIKKHVVLSRQMQLQSIDAFETWLITHLAKRIRVAKEKHVLTRLDDPTYGIKAENKISGTLSDAEVLKIMSLIDADGERVVYANQKTIWTVIAALTDTEGRKLFIPNSMSDPMVAGRIYGAAVKPDANLADNVIYAGVKGQVLANEFEELEIVPQIEPKTLNRIFTGYSLFDAGLENPAGFVKYTHSAG